MRLVLKTLWRGLLATSFAAIAMASHMPRAEAQTASCRAQMETCRQDCAQKCVIGDRVCLRNCRRGVCRERHAACLADNRAPTTAPIPSPAPASPIRKRAAPSVQAMEAPAPVSADMAGAQAGPALNGRVLFLSSNLSEPEAEYYGYLLIGQNVSASRKRAVAKAIACRLEALPNAEAAQTVERLGLLSLPSLNDAGSTRVTADDVLQAYDFTRAARWLRAAGYASGQEFHPNSAIVFIGSTIKRARQMDGVALPGSRTRTDPVIADASGLSANFAAAWVGQIVDGLKAGKVRSRQELQVLMEASSWLDWASQPIVALVTVGQAHGADAPAACPS